ncbi:helix-turn-helix transcriptional regulator [Flavobacterium psychrophilum]|uniref:helix-turn-helix domain-containing protein n=1 Tax=Flavobacterium psychrophilum TaxID=96345 RepID=UPI001C8F3701|nr:helix-turn-helix transcriptional regulator [Flavobacterium psychrophilum]ELY1977896.1 helix-turn-helix transcriptional regulator [Flavobacterium psychrophilum]ELY1990890.1 helix-turn-helix transcriptional regulator [Flavobacterium psychrophilum]QZK98647.1 helix-turn-helix transcriptional regulator [Flavobacterium psychrophilum]
MHTEIIKKLKKLRVEKNITPLEMSEKLHIDISAYNRLESGKTLTWAKYLEDLLVILEVTPEDFFTGITTKFNIIKNNSSYGGNVNVENFYTDNKEKIEKIESLYEERLKDKDTIIFQLQKIIDKLLY